MTGHDKEVDELRAQIDCRVVLEKDGWGLDAVESTKRASKYREGDRVIIVIHDGKGWFDPIEGGKGDVFSLAQYLWKLNFGEARRRLRPLAGLSPDLVALAESSPAETADVRERWTRAKALRPTSQGWAYLAQERALPGPTIERAIHARVIREGVYGTVWAAHRSPSGEVIGWEMRGKQFRGFTKGGTKSLFWVGGDIRAARRVCVAEAFIDALSLAALEGWRDGTVYASTGGGFGPVTAETLKALVPSDARLVAATDLGRPGEILAKRLHELAQASGLAFSRMRPEAKDWNEQLVGPADAGTSH